MNLKAYLGQNGVWYRLIEKGKETIHTKDAALAAGLDLNRLTKSLIFLDEDEKPVLLIIPGNKRASDKKAAGLLGCKELRLAPFEQADKYSGFPPGATPPVGHRKRMRTVIDNRLMAYETIYGGGGSRELVIEMKPADIVKLNNAIIGDIVQESEHK